MLALVLADNLTGIGKFYRTNNYTFSIFNRRTWKHISSKGIGLTINKLTAYFILIICSFLIDLHIFNFDDTVLYFTKIISAAIAFRELLSIIENVEGITGTKLLRTIRNLLTKGIKGGLEESLEKEVKEKEEE